MDNRIEIFQDTTTYVDIWINDASGAIPNLETFDYYLYASKDGINDDLSLGANKVNSSYVTFFIDSKNLEPGDYSYQVVAEGFGSTITIVQDILSVLKNINK